LVQRKSLAKTSGRPGKTQLINHFVINKNWYLVDLPGYGYARVSKKSKKTFQKFITQYFEQRRQLVLAFVLVDIRHEPQPIDVEFMAYLGHQQIPFHIIFTKADKLKPMAQTEAVKKYEQELLNHWEEMPQYFISSSSNGQGREELLQYIDQLNQSLKTQP
jgi:GTP-binding protein